MSDRRMMSVQEPEGKERSLEAKRKGRGRFLKTGVGCAALVLGCLFLLYGIHRKEHLTVEKKSNMICLECIGIG